MTLTATIPIARRRKSLPRVGLSLLTVVIVLVRFWPTYCGSPLLIATTPQWTTLTARILAVVGGQGIR